MAVLLLVACFLINIAIIQSDDTKQEITLFAISNIFEDGTGDGTSITGGQWIAMQEINNNTNLLSDYKLNLQGKYNQKFITHSDTVNVPIFVYSVRCCQ